MITLLVVTPAPGKVEALSIRHPSVEILRARDSEEAIEKLARNRRIDAVLLLAGEDSAAIAQAIREEDPGGPPIFVPSSAGSLPGIRALPAEDPARLLELITRELSS